MSVRPFRGVRQPRYIPSEVASRPYHALNSVDAQNEAGEKSLLHIIKQEIDYNPIIDQHL